MTLIAGLIVIGLAIVAVARQMEVRLVLSLAALALGVVAGQALSVLQKGLATFGDEQFVLPICSAMGFAFVLRQTGCDKHLVQMLVGPVRRVRPLLIPATVVIGFLVNIPIISQTSTAVSIGPVLTPLLRAARVSPLTIGAALLLGSSIGGELLNPGAPEFQTIARALHVDSRICVVRMWPLLLIHLLVTTALFWWLAVRADAAAPPAAAPEEPVETTDEPAFRVSPMKALVPLVPLVLLFVTGPPLELVKVDSIWLVTKEELTSLQAIHPEAATQDLALAKARPRIIALAMMIGAMVAAATAWRSAGAATRAFFEGAGYAFAHIISLIVCASAFGQGVKAIGLAGLLGQALEAMPGLFLPSALLLPLLFAILCGSGFAATASLFGFFVEPSEKLGVDAVGVGSLVSLSAAAGRAMSPVSAVGLMCGEMTGTPPILLARRVALPLLAGLSVVLFCKMALGW